MRVSMEHPDLAEGFILESPFVAPSESAIGWHKTLGEDLKIYNAIKNEFMWPNFEREPSLAYFQSSGAQFLSFVLPDLKLPLVEPFSLSGDEHQVRQLVADPLCSVNLGMSTNLISLLAKEIKRMDNVLPLISKPFWKRSK